MIKSLLNVFRIPELRNKVLFTIFLLMIYRLGYHVMLPGVDKDKISNIKAKDKDNQGQQNNNPSPAEQLAQYVSLFSGGDLQSSTIFGLGIMPYISASIIFQLLVTVVPALEKLQKEGESGRRKIQEWQRYVTVPLCVIQAVFWLRQMTGPGSDIIKPQFAGTFTFWFMSLAALTAGCLFLMWLGEQIDEYGLGNGVSLIIMAGIIGRMPSAIFQIRIGDQPGDMNIGKILFLLASFVFIVAGAILITQAQRRINIQQAKHTRGKRIYGGQKQYLPLRVNHGGVMPIIFAQSLMLFPSMFFNYLYKMVNQSITSGQRGFFTNLIGFFAGQMGGRATILYTLVEMSMIYFFAYFWTTVQFQPKEMATQLQEYGSFVHGLRPGKRTAEYLEKVMYRITFVGAGFLCIIAVVPTFINAILDIPFTISQFLGGTGLLIVVSVALDMIQRIEASLLMRNYSGFLGDGKRIKGRQY